MEFVCIVTSAVAGPNRASGLGTHALELARFLTAQGQVVTILHTGAPDTAFDPGGTPDTASWCSYFKDNERVELVFLDDTRANLPVPVAPWSREHTTSHRVATWLRDRPWVAIHFQDRLGHGAIPLRLKHTARAFATSLITVTVHGPSEWLREARGEFPHEGTEDLITDALERTAVALADVLLCPTKYMREWLTGHHWTLPAVVRQAPLLCEVPVSLPHTLLPGELREVIYFGCAERRGGFGVWLEALERLASNPAIPDLTATVLGPWGQLGDQPAEQAFAATREKLDGRFTLAHVGPLDREAAHDWLRSRRDALVTLPALSAAQPYAALEALILGVPLLASDRGGFTELVRSPAHLVAPTSTTLAERIAAVHEGGLPPLEVNPAAAARSAWSTIAIERAAERTLPPDPKVSVCIPHYNQPALLEETLRLLTLQEVPPLEVIVVDRGSTDPATPDVLDRLEHTYASRGWRILRVRTDGPGPSRNLAAAEATGDALLFVDADNRPAPNMVGSLARALASTGAHIVTCAFRTHRDSTDPMHGRDAGYIFSPLGPFLELAWMDNVIGDTNFIVSRNTFFGLGGFVADRPDAAEDWLFLLRAVRAGLRIGVVPDVLFGYRLGAYSRSRENSEYANARTTLSAALAGDDTPLHRLALAARGAFTTLRSALPLARRAESLERELHTSRAETERQRQLTLAAQESAADAHVTREELARTRDALRRSEEQLGQARSSADASAAACTQAEQALAATREKLESLDQQHATLAAEHSKLGETHTELEQRLASVTAERESVKVDAALRQSALAEAHTRLEQSIVELGELQRHIALTSERCTRLESRVERLQSSAGWKLTQPLRNLRRWIPASWLSRPPAAKTTIIVHFDSPLHWDEAEPKGTISGWAFALDGTPTRRFRLRAGGLHSQTTRPINRPDVEEAHPAAGLTAGFSFAYDLPASARRTITVLLELEDGRVELAAQRVLRVAGTDSRVQIAPSCPSGTQVHFDSPADWGRAPKQAQVCGWHIDPAARQAEAFRLKHGDRELAQCVPVARADVVAAHPQAPATGVAGFHLEIEMPDARKAELALEVRRAGTWEPLALVRTRVSPQARPAAANDYASWLKERDPRGPAADAALRTRLEALPRRPFISVAMPVYNPPERWLRRAIESVRGQVYETWELCIADDASTQPHVRRILEEAAAADPRVRVVFRKENGHISAASNSALELCRGEWTALLDHDDELHPHALAEIALAATYAPDAALIYTDEDKIDEEGRRSAPYFKPDWNPDLLLGQNFCCHLTTVRTERLREVEGFRRGYEGSQDWDLMLRLSRKLRDHQIVHVPRVLYHWRAHEASTAQHLSAKDYVKSAAARAIEDHLAACSIAGTVEPVRGGHWRVRRSRPDPAPLVSIVIPTKDAAGLVRAAIESIRAHTDYPHYELILVDNRSSDRAALALFEELERSGVRVLRYDKPFNYSALNNWAAAQVSGDILLFLNNDITVETSSWLDEMVSHAVRPEIGCVGALLLYPDRKVQHAGVVLGIAGPRGKEGVAGHAFKGFPADADGYFNRLRLVQNYSALTAACLAVRREVFERVGGFDAEHLPVAFNDVDLCLRVRELGLRNLWTPFAVLVHHESASRGAEDTPEKKARFAGEIEYMRARWHTVLDNDPAYNPNLTLVHEDFSIAHPPRPAPSGAGPTAPTRGTGSRTQS